MILMADNNDVNAANFIFVRSWFDSNSFKQMIGHNLEGKVVMKSADVHASNEPT